ncbi:MAG: FMN-dependent L-lactate dehydrogenase LldD [Gammaproteobacteria bacterium]
MVISSPSDFRLAARARLPRFLFDYIDGGSGTESTLEGNVADLARLALSQRVMGGVSEFQLGTEWFGRKQALPVALAPVGILGMFARRGEAQAASAARKKGVPFCLSTVSVCSLEEVTRGSQDPVWFQLYVLRDRAFMRDLLAVVKSAGCSALVLTVDMAVPGVRYRDARSGMSGPRSASRRFFQALRHPKWAWDVGLHGRPHTLGNVGPILGKTTGLEDYIGWLGQNFDPSLRWKDLDWIRELWDGPLIIKGILHPQDARLAVSLGANGIVVSNHGGRQLDGALSPARVLPSIVDVVGKDLLVLADSGVRSGVDVIKMMALGASGVLLGRAAIYALAARGEAGVTQMLDLFEKEMRVTMALTGVSDLNRIDRSVLADVPWETR